MDLSHYEREAVRSVAGAAASAFAPTSRLTVSEWADRNRVLTSAESSEPGPWKTSRVPFIREIMDTLSTNDPTQIIVFMKPTQVAGTETIVNWAGYVIDQASAPMLVVEPTIEIGKLWSKQRFDNMVNGCRVLSQKLPPVRSRDGGNTTMLKEYPGGLLRVGGANSAVSLRSMPARNLGLDEIDGYPDDLDGEGDPIRIAMERTNNFPRRKIMLCSTPTIHEASNIEEWFERSDQRHYYVPCPHCYHKQLLMHDRMRYSFVEGHDGDPDYLIDVEYICEGCGKPIHEHHKTWMLENGEWRAKYPGRKIRGYHINSYYSPVGLGRTWRERAEDFLRARKDPTKLKVFVNTALAETWKISSSDIKADKLRQRAGQYRLRSLPPEVLLLTAGIDTQDDRLEMYVWGWGRDQRCWLVDYQLIDGSPIYDETWKTLTEHLQYTYRSSAGIPMLIESAAIDTAGHHTHRVYSFVRQYRGSRLFAIKGADNKPLVSRPSKMDVKEDGTTISNGVRLWFIGVAHAKDALFGWLAIDGKPEVGARDYFVNFPQDPPDDFYEQLTAEVFNPTHKRWVKKKNQPRNEALDCWGYAYWAACAPPLRIQNAQPHDWLTREKLYQPPTGDMFAALPPPVTTTEPVQPVTQESPAPSGASSFIEGIEVDHDWLLDEDE